jgi:GABA(A) receptor-associated protein
MFQNIINKVECLTNNEKAINNYEERYNYINNFKKQKLEKRIQLSDSILLKYPDRIPVIAECNNDIKIDKNKYMVPLDLSVGQFLYILKKRINLEPTQSIFLLCNNKLLMNTDLLNTVYKINKNMDGFLYIYISLENTFGNNFSNKIIMYIKN